MAEIDSTLSVVTRSEAKSLGSKLYFTGKSCKQGHVAQRITLNGYCVECSRASARRYRTEHPDDFRKSVAASKKRNHDKSLAARRALKHERDGGLAARLEARSRDRDRRAESLLQGSETYDSVRQCKHGHVGQRFTKSYGCVECWKSKLNPDSPEVVAAREARRERAVAYREMQEFSIKNRAAAVLTGEKQYVGAPCKHGHAGLRWTASYGCVECGRIAEVKDRKRKYDLEYRAANPDKCLARARAWTLANPEKRKSAVKAYSARRRQNVSGGDSTAVVHAWEMAAKKVCYWCGKKCAKKYHVDHYYPLSKGGLHAVSNLVIACPTCNIRKNAKDPEQFRAETWHGTLFSNLITP